MATGAYDSNGIWKYGEDDNISLFSTTLNKLADSVSAAETADRARLATLEAGSLAGLIPIVPTSVTPVTGTAAVNNLGTVTITGCTNVILGGVFSARYNNYLILFRNTAATGSNAGGHIRFMSGTTERGNFYFSGFQSSSGTTFEKYSAAGANEAIILLADTGNSQSFELNVFNPFLPVDTTWHSKSAGWQSGGVNFQRNLSGVGGGQNSCDGIKLTWTTGTFSGLMTVYGYNN